MGASILAVLLNPASTWGNHFHRGVQVVSSWSPVDSWWSPGGLLVVVAWSGGSAVGRRGRHLVVVVL